MDKITELQFLSWLKTDCEYRDVRPLPGHRYCAIVPLLFTHRIIVGKIGDETGYDDMWCYSTYDEALAALLSWDGTGEPSGWHRHPASGRRRPDGNELAEYVAE